MTIAAGFVCADGLVLAADTLLSCNYRSCGPKVWLITRGRLSVCVAGAGDYVLMRLAKEAIERHVRHMKGSLTPLAVKHQAIEPTLKSLHDDHIDKAPDYDRQLGYSVSLLVGVSNGRESKLYETNKRSCAEVNRLVCIGSGAPVGNYVGETLFSASVPTLWGQVLAAYLIQQTKTWGEDCGGDTDIAVLPTTTTARILPHAEIRNLERVGSEIHQALGPVLFSCADPVGDHAASIEAFRNSVAQGRNAITGAIAPASPRVLQGSKRGQKSGPPSQV